MPRRTVQPTNLAVPAAPYVPVAGWGNTVWVSGQVPLSPQGEVVGEGDIAAQTRQVLDNLEACLVASGLGLADVVKTTVFLTDMANYAAYNEVYARVFPEDPPARSTVQSGPLVRPEFLVEIEAVAVATTEIGATP